MTAKLQKQKAYKYKGKQIFKHVIVIPEDAVVKLGWNGGQSLELDIENNRLTVKPKNKDSEQDE
jgi:hypothetical protein